MIALLAAVVVLASAQNVAAPPVNALPEARQLAEDAMKLVAANDLEGLFAHIGKHMPMKKEELDAIHAKFVELRKPLPEAVGKVLGYSLIGECRKSDVLVRYTFIEKREKSVVRWYFILYKPRNAWHFTNFYMDQDVNALFQPCG